MLSGLPGLMGSKVVQPISGAVPVNKPIMFSTLFLLELLGDEFKYIGTHLAHSKKKVDEILPFIENGGGGAQPSKKYAKTREVFLGDMTEKQKLNF